MADEPQQDEEQPKDDAQSEEAGASEEQTPEAEASAESGDGDDAAELAEDAATEAPEQPAQEDSGGEASSKEPAKAGKDLPPGADLDPIALELTLGRRLLGADDVLGRDGLLLVDFALLGLLRTVGHQVVISRSSGFCAACGCSGPA